MSGLWEKGTVIKDRYRIEKFVGKGGQKTVYLATDISGQLGDRKLALKEMIGNPSDSHNIANMHLFEQEAILLKNLKHAAIPRVYDYFIDQGKYYIVQEFIEGESLSNLLHKHSFSQDEALRLVIQMADCLQYLHRHRPPIIYRDLKPQNVKVNNNQVHFIDFSGALLPGIGEEAEKAVVFSRGYTPPDVRKRKKIDYTFDTYSLGVVLFEMLTRYDVKSSSGKLPDIQKIRGGISPEIREIVNKAVYPSHYWQYQTMWEMKMELINARNSLKKLAELEEKKEKNSFAGVLIFFHQFHISLVQPMLAFFIFFLLGVAIGLPPLLSFFRPGVSFGILDNSNFLYGLALYILVVQIIWGRWFGGNQTLSRFYRRLHGKIHWLRKIRFITLLQIINVAILMGLIGFFLVRGIWTDIT
ncbi:MAG: serine/threonine-protein kinase [Candidatus Eremiobacteraeota bacterium]|nr:serine/threonine-protein kinase [Candidatus Eremiobacteraeota bacterium]